MPDDDFRIRLGRAVRAARARQGLTQGALAERLRLRRTSVTNIEAGDQGMSVDLLLDLSAALGISPQELLANALASAGADESALPVPVRSGVDEWSARVISKSRAAVPAPPPPPPPPSTRRARRAG